MTADGWKLVVDQAARDHEFGDDAALDLLVQLLTEQDAAKEQLRRKGYGVTGTPWIEIVREVPDSSTR